MLKKSSVLTLFILVAAIPRLTAAATPVPAAPSVSAEAYLLVDFVSGAVLAEKEADRRVEPASITKVMTTYVIFKELEAGNLNLDDVVTISDNAWRKSMRTSRMFLEPRTRVTIKELLMGVIVQSGNDASIALAEHVAGSEQTFAAMMNAYGAQLGMTGTNFTNSTGLPGPDHYTTARDLVTLAAATIREFPTYYEWYSEPEYSFNGITQPNRNKLLRQETGTDGINRFTPGVRTDDRQQGPAQLRLQVLRDTPAVRRRRDGHKYTCMERLHGDRRARDPGGPVYHRPARTLQRSGGGHGLAGAAHRAAGPIGVGRQPFHQPGRRAGRPAADVPRGGGCRGQCLAAPVGPGSVVARITRLAVTCTSADGKRVPDRIPV
jgi:hypothetical protein